MSLDIGLDISRLTADTSSPLQMFPGVAIAADFTRGLYHAEGGKSLSQFLDSVPSGQPTASGLYVTSNDQPLMVQGRGSELFNDQPFVVAGSILSFDGNVAIPTGTSWGCYVAVDIDVVAGRTYEASTVGQGTEQRWAHSGANDYVSLNPSAPQVIPAGKTKLRLARQVSPTGSPSPTGNAELYSASVREVTPFAGYDPANSELTFAVEWEGVPALTGTSRYLAEFRLSQASGLNRGVLFIGSNNSLELGVADGSTYQGGANAGLSFDDGGRHRAVCCLNRASGDLKLSVDGGAPVTANKAGQMPSGFTSLALGHSHGSTHANGCIRLVAAVSGDKFDAWR